MKLLLATILTLLFFSGCTSDQNNLRLQNRNAKQALLIQRQNAQIAALKARMAAKAKRKAYARRMSAMPKPPKKNIKLKKVEDNNYSSGYMYPGAQKKKKPIAVAQTTSSSNMSKAECITMIGQDKFDKYTQMFGSEAASLKRCKMLKAMKQ